MDSPLTPTSPRPRTLAFSCLCYILSSTVLKWPWRLDTGIRGQLVRPFGSRSHTCQLKPEQSQFSAWIPRVRKRNIGASFIRWGWSCMSCTTCEHFRKGKKKPPYFESTTSSLVFTYPKLSGMHLCFLETSSEGLLGSRTFAAPWW